MTNVLEFHIELVGLEKNFWRDIQISDNTTVAKLGYTIMASFEGQASHLFNIKYKERRYELLVEQDEFEGPLGPAINPMKVKLKDFSFEPGDILTMEYDYGAGWEWTIEYKNKFPMRKGTGKHYPYITAGAGRGIIEDTSVGELKTIIKQIEKRNEPIVIPDYRSPGGEKRWDHRWWDLDCINGLLKWDIEEIRYAYEEPFESGEVDAAAIYLKDLPPVGENIIDFTAQQKWMSIAPSNRELLLGNAFCLNCHVGIFNQGYKLRNLSNGDIAIDGTCQGCGEKICRVVEKEWWSTKV